MATRHQRPIEPEGSPDGAEMARQFHQFAAIEAKMPDGGRNRVEIAVCSVPILLAMQGFAMHNRMKRMMHRTFISVSATIQAGSSS